MRRLSSDAFNIVAALEEMRPAARERDRERLRNVEGICGSLVGEPMKAPEVWSEEDLAIEHNGPTVKAKKGPRWLYGCAACYQTGGWVGGGGDYRYTERCVTCAGLDFLVDNVNGARLPSKFYGRNYDRSRLALVGTGASELLKEWGRGVTAGEAVSGAAFIGPPGRGKSHLAFVIGQWAMFKGGRRVRWVNWPKHLENIRASYGDKRCRPAECWDGLPSNGLVVVDDFGASRSTEWARDQSWALFEECPPSVQLLITSNLNPAEVGAGGMSEALGERAASRLMGQCGAAIFVFGGGEPRRAV